MQQKSIYQKVLDKIYENMLFDKNTFLSLSENNQKLQLLDSARTLTQQNGWIKESLVEPSDY